MISNINKIIIDFFYLGLLFQGFFFGQVA